MVEREGTENKKKESKRDLWKRDLKIVASLPSVSLCFVFGFAVGKLFKSSLVSIFVYFCFLRHSWRGYQREDYKKNLISHFCFVFFLSGVSWKGFLSFFYFFPRHHLQFSFKTKRERNTVEIFFMLKKKCRENCFFYWSFYLITLPKTVIVIYDCFSFFFLYGNVGYILFMF